MAVSTSYKAFVLEQLSQVAPVTAKGMFGGVGVYCEGLFFAIMDDDSLFFKVDDSTRGDYQAQGMKAFDPFKDGRTMEGYYEVPGEILEDEERLEAWMIQAVEVATRKKKPKKDKQPRPGKR